MDDIKNVVWGVILQRNKFFIIYKLENYWNLYIVDDIPVTGQSVEDFMESHIDDGCSLSGTLEEIMDEFRVILADMGLNKEEGR